MNHPATLPIALIACLGLWTVCGRVMPAQAAPPIPKIRVLLVTGGHEFEHDDFLAVFKSMPDVECIEVTHPDVFGWFTDEKSAKYDVIVLYDMVQKIPDAAKKDFVRLLERGKGLVAMHHCLANYQDWPEFEKIIGGKYHLEDSPQHPASTFKHDVEMSVRVLDDKHPITAGLKDFDILDEAYNACSVAKDVTPLLGTDNPHNNKLLAWAHRYGNARVAYIQLGHGPSAYRDATFRRLVGQAIRWAAEWIPTPPADKDGFVPLFNGNNLDGWIVTGDPKGFSVRDGLIGSEGDTGGLWLRSARMYADFVLKLEWRVSIDGNSGVFIRCTEQGYPWETGSEIQITSVPRDDMHCTGSLYGSVAVDPRPDESPNKWHEFEIRCEGPRITVLVDNVKVVDADSDTVDALKNKPRVGYIGLQDSHTLKYGYIQFRNIRIKELHPATPPAP